MGYETTTTTPRYAPLGVRLLLTAAGAAALIVGAFLTWVPSLKGTDLAMNALWRPEFHATETFVATLGFAAILVGLAGLAGMALVTGWLTRLAGMVGIVGFALFAIEANRGTGIDQIDIGAWLALCGAVLLLVGGFVGGRRAVTTVTSSEA